MKKKFVRTEENIIKSMKSMMESCFAYHSLTKDNSYIATYKTQLSEEVFNKTFDEYEEYLNDTYEIFEDVGTCSDGLSYNSMQKKVK